MRLHWAVSTVIAVAIVVVVMVVTSANVRHMVCDRWGPGMEQLQGDPIVWTEPPWYATEVSGGCYEVPWWGIF